MKSRHITATVFVITLVVVVFLPLYVQRTMTRSMTMGSGGDIIDYGWRIVSLTGYISGYQLLRPEESPALFLATDIILAVIYAALITLLLKYLLFRSARLK